MFELKIAKALATAAILSLVTASGSLAASEDIQKTISNLIAFDMVDFVGWNNHDMTVLRHYHGGEVAVDMAGIHTDGLDPHLDFLKQIIDAGQANTILQHLPKVGEGDWTAVGGVTAKGHMATVAKWSEGGIVEEHLFLRKMTDDETAAIDLTTATVTITTPDDAELQAATGAAAGWSAAMGKDYVVFTRMENGSVAEKLGFAVQ